jgi:hypothetical protein
MCITDKYPTEYNLQPVRLDAPPAAPEAGRITQIEQAALKSVDIAEQINEPVNGFSLARAAVRLTARAARKLRK